MTINRLEVVKPQVFTSRKAGQHVLLVQGGRGTGVTFSFLETSVHVKPLENL